MLQTLRERLTLLLIALLPFHALLVTVVTKLIAGPGQAPLPALALWKEMLLGVILVLSVVEVIILWRTADFGQRTSDVRLDVIDVLIIVLLLLGVAVTAFTHGDWKLAALGFRYDFVPLVAFLVARRVAWSDRFRQSALKTLLWVGAIVAAYGILTAFLPMRFFLWLGYSPAHSLYFADGPLAAFQQVSETMLRRVQSVMSGPNQLGVWLLLSLSVCLVYMSSWKAMSDKRLVMSTFVVCLLLNFFVLFLTFSRAAWIAAFVMILVVLGRRVPRRIFGRVVAGALLSAVIVGAAVSYFPQPRRAASVVFFRLSSSRGHLVRPLQAIARMAAHPFGEGLGAAGPASNRVTLRQAQGHPERSRGVSETCVFLRPQDDPSWAKVTPRLCVFLGTTQVQPVDHVCRCPFLPENWYLQVGVELGVLGFVLFVALVVIMLKRLAMSDERLATATRQSADHFVLTAHRLPLTAYLAFLGVSIAALFLHAWEDSAVAYTVWLLAAVSLRSSPKSYGRQVSLPLLRR